jgi:hypothetical protein
MVEVDQNEAIEINLDSLTLTTHTRPRIRLDTTTKQYRPPIGDSAFHSRFRIDLALVFLNFDS